MHVKNKRTYAKNNGSSLCSASKMLAFDMPNGSRHPQVRCKCHELTYGCAVERYVLGQIHDLSFFFSIDGRGLVDSLVGYTSDLCGEGMGSIPVGKLFSQKPINS